jgi:hypothetical protein
MNNDNSVDRDQFRKETYVGKNSIKCVVCHKSHNLKQYKSKYVIFTRDECFEFQKAFDPDLKKTIIKGAVCDRMYDRFRYTCRKRKAEIEVNNFLFRVTRFNFVAAAV